MSREWTNGLFGCFNDVTTCIISLFVPCYTLGMFAHVTIRGKIREQKGIEGTCLKDALVAIFCYPCALTQESQEVQPPPPESMPRE